MPREILHSSALLLFAEAGLAQAREFCFGVNNEQYRCEMGYCCGETECCTYYYELWCEYCSDEIFRAAAIDYFDHRLIGYAFSLFIFSPNATDK
ncbi:hypothetical protein DNTS_030558 [Danionella cerebrum]|uniref:Uncharacterized protein n=1 Tax=Danionella cerebrum TaxID=2873325 RepID=A0A553NWE2_9TELE|nr:hypothetical protein DNTS_030558 [Danionella translucida]